MLPRMNANHFIRSAVIRGKRRKFCGTDTIDVATISRFECWKKWSANGSLLSVSIDRIYRESAGWMREISRFSLSRRIQSRHARSVRITYGRPFPTRKSSRFRVGDREILYPRRKWGDAKKKKREREERLGGSLCRMPPPPRFSRATLVRVSYYLTLPYGFPLNRECCSLNFIKAVSPSFESCQCCIVESHSSFAVSQRR